MKNTDDYNEVSKRLRRLQNRHRDAEACISKGFSQGLKAQIKSAQPRRPCGCTPRVRTRRSWPSRDEVAQSVSPRGSLSLKDQTAQRALGKHRVANHAG